MSSLIYIVAGYTQRVMLANLPAPDNSSVLAFFHAGSKGALFRSSFLRAYTETLTTGLRLNTAASLVQDDGVAVDAAEGLMGHFTSHRYFVFGDAEVGRIAEQRIGGPTSVEPGLYTARLGDFQEFDVCLSLHRISGASTG